MTFSGSTMLEDVKELTKFVATADANWERNDDILQRTLITGTIYTSFSSK